MIEVKDSLIIQTAFLGDLLLGIPFFKALRLISPEGHISLVCRRGLGSFLCEHGLIDQVIEIDKADQLTYRAATDFLKTKKFDLLISPHMSVRSALLAARVRATRKIGYARFFNRLIFHERIQRPMALPEALRQLALLSPLDSGWAARLKDFEQRQMLAGGQSAPGELLTVPDWAEMTIPRLKKIGIVYREFGDLSAVAPRVRDLIRSMDQSRKDDHDGHNDGHTAGQTAGQTDGQTDSSRQNHQGHPSGPHSCGPHSIGQRPNRIAAIGPGSVWPTKMWGKQGFAEVARELIKRGYRVVVLGALSEQAICTEVAQLAPGAVSWAGKTTLSESAEILALSEIAVCNDSGAMHLAAAAGVPTVAIFGPTVLEFGYRPWQTHAKVVQVGDAFARSGAEASANHVTLSCRPCGKHGAKKCPIGTHECMTRVSARQVLAAIDQFKR